MWEPDEVWLLVKDGDIVGRITLEEGDWPWVSGRFAPTAGFAPLRPLFDRELELLEAEDWEAWDALVQDLDEGLQLMSPSGPVDEFLLHVEGDRAWFRSTVVP